MAKKTNLRLWLAMGILSGPLLSNLQAEVTLDQVRDEIRKEMKANPAPATIDQSKIDFKSGTGIPLVRSPNGELKMNLYMLVRYLNQLPASQSFEDHLGNPHDIDTANYISCLLYTSRCV